MSNQDNTKVSVLIPAHNEEKTIIKTLKDLLVQDLVPTQIIVICDNCTDNTVHLVNNFINNTSINISILETIDNNAKKAGALNQAFAKINLEDYVLIMDADTSLDRSALKCALDLMRTDAKMGAVCSRAGILPFEGKSLWKKNYLEPAAYRVWAI